MNHYVGEEIWVMDEIERETVAYMAIIKKIEQDNEYPNLYWLYLRASDESLNVNTDPSLNCTFWRLIEANSPFILTAEQMLERGIEFTNCMGAM